MVEGVIYIEFVFVYKEELLPPHAAVTSTFAESEILLSMCRHQERREKAIIASKVESSLSLLMIRLDNVNRSKKPL